jgi:hypothetical protein
MAGARTQQSRCSTERLRTCKVQQSDLIGNCAAESIDKMRQRTEIDIGKYAALNRETVQYLPAKCASPMLHEARPRLSRVRVGIRIRLFLGSME